MTEMVQERIVNINLFTVTSFHILCFNDVVIEYLTIYTLKLICIFSSFINCSCCYFKSRWVLKDIFIQPLITCGLFKIYFDIVYCQLSTRIGFGLGWFMVFNAAFNNISVISWMSVLLMEETIVLKENHRPVEVTDKLYHY